MNKRKPRMSRVAVYAGSFDPVTMGHEDIVRRAAPMFDTLYVGVGINSSKQSFLPTEDRLALLRESFSDVENVVVAEFRGLLVNFCRMCGARYIVRGIRAMTDFEYEQVIAHANKTQAPDIETVFLVTSPHLSYVSSSVVRELVKHGGDVGHFVSPHVAQRLARTNT